ncbi:MAG: PilZ domain-containing protein [Spirochaetes bacterium]|nr:PilZ domain-containing protein [Spirochaetota bacterium]
MKERYIKYEKLSKGIKDEISHFRQRLQKENPDTTLETAMIQWFDTRFDEWLVKHYAKGGGENKRKHFRLDVELPLKVINTLIESSADDVEAMNLVGRVVNISRGGLYFKYHSSIEISSIIKVVMDFAEIDGDLDSVEALAMVVRVDPLKEGEFGIGVVFSSIYEGNKESLDVFILKNLSYYIYTK